MNDRSPGGARHVAIDVEAKVLSPHTYLSFLPASRREIYAEVEERPRRWVGYGRYSTERQLEDSLDRQRNTVEHLWKAPGNGLVAWCADAARTGTTTAGRKGLARLQEIVRARGCDAVCVEDVDRLSRNVGQLLQIFEEMQQHDVELWDAKHGRLEWLQVYIFGLMAQLGRERLLSQMKGGAEEKIRKGQVFARPTFGFVRDRNDRRLLVVDEELRGAVVWIFERIADGATPNRVARDLNERFPEGRPGARPRQDGKRQPFNQQYVTSLVQNEHYMGLNVWGKKRQVRDFLTRKVTGRRFNALADQLHVEIPRLRIVSTALWARANAALGERNAALGGTGRRAGPFSGLVFCECGARMRRCGPPDRKGLICETHAVSGAPECPHGREVPLAWIEDVLLSRLILEVDDGGQEGLFRRVLGRAVADRVADRRARRREAERERDLLDERLASLERGGDFAGYSPDWLAGKRRVACARKTELEAALLAWETPSAYERILADVPGLRAGFEALRARLPFKVESAEDQVLVDAVGEFVRDIRLNYVPGTERLLFRMRIRLDEEREEPVDGQLDIFVHGAAGTPDYLVEFEADLAGCRENRRTTGADKRAAAREEVAASGVHDVSDRVWKVIAPLVAEFDFSSGGTTLDARTAFDGFFFALRTPGTDLAKLPARFGAPNTVYLLMRRLARDGTLDRIVEALSRKAPAALAGCDLARLYDTRFIRSAKVAGARSKAELTPEDARRLIEAAEAQTSEAARNRMLAVAKCVDGAPFGRTAKAHGFSKTHLSNLFSAFRSGDIQALRARPHLGPPSAFTPALVEDLRAFVAFGFDPDRPDRPLTLARVARYLKERGVELCIEHIARKMRSNGIGLSEAVAAARIARAAAGKHRGSEARMPPGVG